MPPRSLIDQLISKHNFASKDPLFDLGNLVEFALRGAGYSYGGNVAELEDLIIRICKFEVVKEEQGFDKRWIDLLPQFGVTELSVIADARNGGHRKLVKKSFKYVQNKRLIAQLLK